MTGFVLDPVLITFMPFRVLFIQDPAFSVFGVNCFCSEQCLCDFIFHLLLSSWIMEQESCVCILDFTFSEKGVCEVAYTRR